MIILYGLEMIIAGALSIMLVNECIRNINECFEEEGEEYSENND